MKSVALLEKSARFARVRRIAESVQHREIPAVVFTDPEVPDEHKQRALIIAGQHGSEESGRAIAIALMQFLESGEKEAADLLRQQIIAVVPCCNPDGAQADTYHNADDVNTAHDFPFEGVPISPESRGLDAFATEFQPDLHVDIHGLAGGSMNDRVWLEKTLGFSPNGLFVTMMAHETALDAEKKGYPVCEAKLPGTLDPKISSSNRIGEKLSLTMNTLGFGLEAIEKYYTAREWCEAGITRLRTLLSYGNSDRFGLGIAGYPNNGLLSGSRLNGLYAHGRTAALRRASRIDISRFLRENYAMVDRGSDGADGMARVRVSSQTINGKNPERFSLSLRFKKPCAVEAVTWNGERLSLAPDHGYRLIDQDHSLQLIADIQAPLGGPERFLEVRYKSPYL